MSPERQLKRIARLESLVDPEYMSSLVVLAQRRPQSPPFSSENNYNELILRAHKIDREEVGGRKRASTSSQNWEEDDYLREKRSIIDIPGAIPQSVCQSNYSWSARRTAFDRDDREVIVLQEILINEIVVNQYFYETTCESKRECYGINHRKFLSICRSTPIFVYAYVINAQGDEGWCHVKVNGACNCALYKREDAEKYLRRNG